MSAKVRAIFRGLQLDAELARDLRGREEAADAPAVALGDHEVLSAHGAHRRDHVAHAHAREVRERDRLELRGGRHDVAHADLGVRDAAVLHEAHRLLAEQVGRR
jgi:hypothetical protein